MVFENHGLSHATWKLVFENRGPFSMVLSAPAVGANVALDKKTTKNVVGNRNPCAS